VVLEAGGLAWGLFLVPARALRRRRKNIAAVAQLVECVLGKDEVMGSNPISS
jgi:hypothetical protein